MNELLRLSLYERANAYLSGQLSLAQLEEWLMQVDPMLVEDPSSELARLSGLLDLGIVDVSRGHISEDDFKAEIAGMFAQQGTITVRVGTQPVTGTGSTIHEANSTEQMRVLASS